MRKILVAYINDGKAGGVDRYALNLREKLQTEDERVDFLTNEYSVDFKKEMNAKGSKVIWVPSLRNPIAQYKCIKKAIEEEKYDVVYFNISTALMYIGPKAAHDAGVKKIIIHSHSSGFDASGSMNRAARTALHNMCKGKLKRYGTDFLACSTEAGLWMFPKGTDFKLVNNAIDVDRHAFNQENRDKMRDLLDINPDEFMILQMGNFLYVKNFEFTVNMFKEYERINPKAVLVLVGDGPLRADIEELAGNSESIVFTGRVDNSEEYMSAADAYIMPSHFEGLSVAAIEAQASGLKCLFSDNVSKETDLTGNCRFLSLENTQAWIDALDELSKGYVRQDTKDVLTKKGYNLASQDLKALIN